MIKKNQKAGIKNRLQNYRVFKGLTQKQLATELNICVSLVRNIEINMYYPKYPIRSKICVFFNVSHPQMFYKENKD